MTLLSAVLGMALEARADGFSTPHTLPFKLNSAGVAISKESLRGSLNAASRANGGGSGGNAQGNSNMANVIQVTENYDIVLNGNDNVLHTGGSKVDGAQDGSGSSQSGSNQIQTNNDSNVATSSAGDATSGELILNP
jgi:hypothetical protein